VKTSRTLSLLATCLLSIALFPGCSAKRTTPARVTLLIQDEQDFLYVPKGTRLTNASGLDMAVNTNGFYISSAYAAKILEGVKLDQIGGDD
jgi:hypothetical protein